MDYDDHLRRLERMYLIAPINQIFKPSIKVSKKRAEIEMEVKEKGKELGRGSGVFVKGNIPLLELPGYRESNR